MQADQPLPPLWSQKTISDLGGDSPSTVQTGPFGAQLHAEDYAEEGVPFLLIKNLQGNGLDISDMPRITYQDAQRLSTYALEPGDIVFSRVGRVGSCLLAGEDQKGWVISGQLLRIRLPSEAVDHRYLIHALRSKPAQDKITGAAVGSTRQSINTQILARLDVLIPSPPEQRQIAAILDTIDAAITQTEALIAKLKQMKAGLMHDLLTGGLDAHGQLRDPAAHPEQFKDTLVGQIPQDWEVYTLSTVVPRAEYGISVSLEDQEGIPVLRMNNLKDGEVGLADLKWSASPEAARLLLRPLDVLFNRTNSMEHVGRTAIWRGQMAEASFASYLVRLVPDRSRLIPEYLNIWLNLEATQRLIRRYATPGVHQVNINPTNLRKVSVALPKSIAEQQTIVNKIDRHNARIRAEESYRDKLQQIKQGLMADLLTGRVRVTEEAIAT